ncbi:hypothetical protein [Salipaludibacillus keqinensis]|uniref:hypothetical protein n=1 Tax=Salipaludibacillus keqinensis TaxID=2045207 RepID=UPI002FCE18E0
MSKTIFITGSRSGFGKGTAIGLAKKGHKVIAYVEIISSDELTGRSEKSRRGPGSYKVRHYE